MKEYLLTDFNDFKKNDLLYDNYSEKLKKAIRKKKSNKKKNNQIINNKPSKKRKRKTKKKTINNSNKKTKKKSKNGLQKGGDPFNTTYNNVIKKINKQTKQLDGIITPRKLNKFIKNKKNLDNIIKKKIKAFRDIIIACLVTNYDSKEKNKDYYKNLKEIFRNLYYTSYVATDQTYAHRFHRKYTKIGFKIPSFRNRSKTNIYKYNRDFLFFKIGKMRRLEYYVNKRLVKIGILQVNIENGINQLMMLESSEDNEKKKQSYKKKIETITTKQKAFKEKFKNKFNNDTYKKFKKEAGNYYLSLLPANPDTVALKQNFSWYNIITRITRGDKNKKDFMQQLNHNFYKKMQNYTKKYLDTMNNLLEFMKTNESESTFQTDYKKYHTVQYLNSKAFYKDMYLFKSVYMFDNEVSLTQLDLGQNSMIDNSIIYYYNFKHWGTSGVITKKTNRGLPRSRIRLERSRTSKYPGILESDKIISLKYLYNLINVPQYMLKEISLYFEDFLKIDNLEPQIATHFKTNMKNCLYHIKSSEQTTSNTESSSASDIAILQKDVRDAQRYLSELKEYSEYVTKKINSNEILKIKKEINKSIEQIKKIKNLNLGDGDVGEIGDDLENMTKELDITEAYDFITMSTFKAMVHLYDYEIENLFLSKSLVSDVEKAATYGLMGVGVGAIVTGALAGIRGLTQKYKSNWHELKSVSTFLNIIPRMVQNEKKKKEYLILKTIKYIYTKLIYLLYFIFNTPTDDDLSKYFVDKNAGKYAENRRYLNMFKPYKDIAKEKTEVFKPSIFFYIYSMIPNESELDTFTKGKEKTESKTAEIPKEKGASLSSKKSRVKLRYEFLKEFGIVHNLISEDVPIGIIYNMYSEYLNEVWNLLFDLESTIMSLQRTDSTKYKDYAKEEDFIVHKFNHKTYPKIYKDLDDIDISEDMNNDLSKEQKDSNKDTYAIYNFTYKNKILYRKVGRTKNWKVFKKFEDMQNQGKKEQTTSMKTEKIRFSKTPEEIETEDNYYKKVINDMNNDNFAKDYIKKLNGKFRYYLNKESNKKNKEPFNDFCNSFKNNIKNIQKYMKKYFKVVNMDSDISSEESDAITTQLSTSDKIKILENIEDFHKDNQRMIENIDAFEILISTLFNLFKSITKKELETYIKLEEEINSFLNDGNYYDFFTKDNGFVSAINKLKQDSSSANIIKENIEQIFEEDNEPFKKDKFNECIKKTIEDENSNLFRIIMTTFKFEPLETKMDEIKNIFTDLQNLQIEKSMKDNLTSKCLIAHRERDNYVAKVKKIKTSAENPEDINKKIRIFFKKLHIHTNKN